MTSSIDASVLRPLDVEELAARFAAAEPFPHVVVDDLLQPAFAAELVASLPSYDQALAAGRAFDTVNEKGKVQLTDAERLPGPARRLLDTLHGPAFLQALGAITGVPHLETDGRLLGGGLHLTGPGGRLDVHVDFNYLPDVERFRRLNLLLYLNPEWPAAWGGELELWDADVSRCVARVPPLLGRCVIFATSDRSYHGTTTIRCPRGEARRSFALYYYSHVPPDGFDDDFHGTVFRARPDERLRGWLLMPAEAALRRLRYRAGQLAAAWRGRRG